MKKVFAFLLIAVLLLTACGTKVSTASGSSSTSSNASNAATTASSSANQTAAASTTASADTTAVTEQPTAAAADADTLADPTDASKEATGTFSIKSDGAKVTQNGSVYTITAAGEYTVSGALADGQIVVNADEEDEVKLILNGASISCSTDAPIVAVNAAELTVKSEKNTYNTVTDLRTGSVDDDAYDAAIYATCDLKLSGKGTLIVTASSGNGVKTKDDLTVKNVTLTVTASGNALRGNDSVTVESGNLILTSTASDAVKTDSTDLSSKGKQRGTVEILDGHVDIYAACDGICAAYNVEISETESCVVNVFTGSYASKAGAASLTEQYLIVPTSLYNQKSDYYAYFYNEEDDEGVWVQCGDATKVYSGNTVKYYGLLYRIQTGYQNILFAVVASGETPVGSNASATTNGDTVNTAMNGYLIASISDGTITGDWVQLSGTSDGGKTTFSSKGVKASNAIVISGGTVAVYASDDGLHAKGGDELDSGSVGVGSVTVDGGSLTVTSADDGVHADGALTVNAGTVNVVEAHEGFEGNVITINGGVTCVYGEDDGVNACAGSATPTIQVNGGYLEVKTPSGDTDAIDANGNFVMTGGTVLVKGGSQMGSVAGSVDVDGTIQVTGGTIVAFGGICEIPTTGSVNVYTASGSTFAAGSYTLADGDGNVIFTFTLDASYTSCWIASDAFVLNGSYTLSKDGTAVLSWTQSSSSEGNYNASSGGFGGFGGRGGW